MAFKHHLDDEIPFGPGDQETKEAAKPLLIGLVVVVVVLIISVVVSVASCRTSPSFTVSTNETNSEKESAAYHEVVVYVHVVGCVANPGVYSVPEGSHVVDAIERAGGFTDDADAGSLNLARAVVDGEQIRVYSIEEVAAQSSGGAASQGIDASGKVNINYASVDELQTVSGIGEVTAKRIVEDREKNGPFTSVDDLARVSGIGEKTVAKMRDSLTV